MSRGTGYQCCKSVTHCVQHNVQRLDLPYNGSLQRYASMNILCLMSMLFYSSSSTAKLKRSSILSHAFEWIFIFGIAKFHWNANQFFFLRCTRVIVKTTKINSTLSFSTQTFFCMPCKRMWKSLKRKRKISQTHFWLHVVSVHLSSCLLLQEYSTFFLRQRK